MWVFFKFENAMGVLKKVSFISALCECFLKLQRGEKKVNSVLGDERLLRYMWSNLKNRIVFLLWEKCLSLNITKQFVAKFHDVIYCRSFGRFLFSFTPPKTRKKHKATKRNNHESSGFWHRRSREHKTGLSMLRW